MVRKVLRSSQNRFPSSVAPLPLCNLTLQGAFGAVYAAEMADGSKAAVKFLDLRAFGGEAGMSGFEDLLAHPLRQYNFVMQTPMDARVQRGSRFQPVLESYDVF